MKCPAVFLADRKNTEVDNEMVTQHLFALNLKVRFAYFTFWSSVRLVVLRWMCAYRMDGKRKTKFTCVSQNWVQHVYSIGWCVSSANVRLMRGLTIVYGQMNTIIPNWFGLITIANLNWQNWGMCHDRLSYHSLGGLTVDLIQSWVMRMGCRVNDIPI